MSGSLTLRIKVRPNGEVEAAQVSSNHGLSDGVAACIAKRAQNATFDAPQGTGSTVEVPVKFVKQ
jgi:hypothetical protein